MRLPEFEHLQPSTLDEALGLLAEYGQEARLNAGGTDLLVSMKQGLVCLKYLINLKEIPGLDFVTCEENGLRIGALTRLETLIRSPLVKEHFPVIAQAARSVAAPPIQTMGTLGGNLCQNTRCLYYNQSEFWREARPDCFKRGGTGCQAIKGGARCYSAYQGDLAPVLIALGAQVKLARRGAGGQLLRRWVQRTIPLVELYTGKGEHPIGLLPDEILTEIEVPRPTGLWGADYQKLRYRGAMDYALVGVAAVLNFDEQECIQAKIVATAIASAPVVMEEAGQILQGKRLDPEAIARAAQAAYDAAHPIASIGSTPIYRRKMVRVLTQRAITRAWGEASGQ